jgi:hypothetical protein
LSRKKLETAPSIAPAQYVPFTAISTRMFANFVGNGTDRVPLFWGYVLGSGVKASLVRLPISRQSLRTDRGT